MRFLLAHVAGFSEHLRGAQRRFQRLQLFCIEIASYELRARTCKLRRGDAAEPAGCTRDEHDLTGIVELHQTRSRALSDTPAARAAVSTNLLVCWNAPVSIFCRDGSEISSKRAATSSGVRSLAGMWMPSVS